MARSYYRISTEFGYYKRIDGKPNWVHRPEDAQLFDSKRKATDVVGFLDDNVRESVIEIVRKEKEANTVAQTAEKKVAVPKPKAKRGYDVFTALLAAPIKLADLVSKMRAEGYTESTVASYVAWSRRPVDASGDNPFGIVTENYTDKEGVKWITTVGTVPAEIIQWRAEQKAAADKSAKS